MNDYLAISDPVRAALDAGRPVVALETSFVAHGLPWPANLETAEAMQSAIEAEGAVPAMIGVTGGRIAIGLSADRLRRFARSPDVAKASRRDLAPLVAAGAGGATTVAATLVCAALAGIEVVATGGIGGVHRGAGSSLDVSADLRELGRTPVAVVCSGAKSILDLPKTLEVLESEGVPVIGFGCDTFPAFHARSSGLGLDHRVDGAAAAADVIAAHRELGSGGVVLANPVPAEAALALSDLDEWTEAARDAARAEGITGQAVTPFLLDRIAGLSRGRTLTANRALLVANAAVGARVATALAARRG